MTFGYNPFIDNFDFKGTSSGGTVTGVTGTANRITSTGGATPQIDIDATYVGQTSLTTLGTVTTGTWNATAVGPTFGGTGQTTYATGDILFASGINTLAKLAAGSNTNVLTLAAGVPTWAAPATNFTGSLVTLGNGAPADSTTYYLTQGSALTSTTVSSTINARFYAPKACTLNTVFGAFRVSTVLGTAENCTLFIRKNDTTNTNISTTIQLTAVDVLFNSTTLGISLAAGDYITFGLTCPAWVTNPTGVGISLSFNT